MPAGSRRTKGSQKNYTPTVNTRVPEKLRTAVEHKADEEGLKRSEAFRLALAEWVGDPELALLEPELPVLKEAA